jgi:putative Holliday junction resolvase
MRVLALDVGESRIGVAISDPNGLVAVPLRVLPRRSLETDVADISGIVAQEGVEVLVVGLPLSLDGTVGRQAQRVQDFVEHLKDPVNLPIVLWDERLSTVQAEQLLRTVPPRSRKARAEQDALAAAIILQGYLDSRQSGDRDLSPE